MKGLSNNKGYTLVELLAVMIIMGIILGIGIPKIISLNKNSEKVGIDVAIIDLNGREMKCWTQLKLDGGGWGDDLRVFDSCDYQINNYKWRSLDSTGGVIEFKETTVKINRRTSAINRPANWAID